MMIWNYFVKLNNLERKSRVLLKVGHYHHYSRNARGGKNPEFIIVDLGYFLDGCGSG